MLNAFKNIQNGNPEEVKNTFLYPLMNWFSSNIKNVRVCNFINKHFFTTKPEILKGLLSLGIEKSQRFMKYPKAKKEEDKKMDIIKPILKKIYGWSARELRFQMSLIDLDDKVFLEDLNQIVGFNKRECKLLNLEFMDFKIDKKKAKEPEQKGLFEKW